VDLQAEGAGTPGQGLADTAHADDAQPLAPQLAAAHPGRGPALELAAGHHRRALDDAPADGENQAHGQVGSVFGQHAGGVGDDQAAADRRLDVDVVHPGTEVGDHLQLFAGPGDQLRVEAVSDGRHQHLGPQQGLSQGGAVKRAVGEVQLGIEQLAHAGLDRVRQAAG